MRRPLFERIEVRRSNNATYSAIGELRADALQTRRVVVANREHAEAVREVCREFLEGNLTLTLNMEKTHITHVNDGFVFLGHRIIRKRGSRGRRVTTIPWEKYRGFAERLVKQLSGNYSVNRMDLLESLNRQIAGWATLYQYTD